MADRPPRRRRGHTRIFVYGTLRAGHGNHHLLAAARLVGDDRTAAVFTMFDLRGYPAVATGGTTRIIGELYEVDPATLAALDRLEGHPRWYERTPVVLASRRHAQLYVMPRARIGPRPVIASGDWRLR